MRKIQGRKPIDRVFLRYELPIMLFLALLPEALMLAGSYFWIETRNVLSGGCDGKASR
jgi:hypothetical protein